MQFFLRRFVKNSSCNLGTKILELRLANNHFRLRSGALLRKQADKMSKQLVSLSEYISNFMKYLYEKTGFKKEAFSRAGLKERLRMSVKRLYQLEIAGELLKNVLYVVQVIADTTKTRYEKYAASALGIINVLEKVTNFLFYTFIGNAVLTITASMYSVLTGFIVALSCCINYLVLFYSSQWFIKLREYIDLQFHSETFLKFFNCFESTKHAIQ